MNQSLNLATLHRIALAALREERETVEYIRAAEFLQGFDMLTLGGITFMLTGEEEMALFAIPQGDDRISFELCRSEYTRRPALEYTAKVSADSADLAPALEWLSGMLRIGQVLTGQKRSGPAQLQVQMPRSRIRPGFGVDVNPADDSPVTVPAIPHAIPPAIAVDPTRFNFDYTKDKFTVASSEIAAGTGIHAKGNVLQVP